MIDTTRRFGQRILILVPHPDDELVACAAAIGRARAEGAELFALYLTHGCPAPENLWPWERSRAPERIFRRLEEARAVASRLGLHPAGFSNRPARFLWRALPAVAEEIQAAIAAHNIDQLWIPAYEGGHADHDGLNGLCALLFRDKLSVLEFAEYNFAGSQTNSQTFPAANGTETFLRLTAEESAEKAEALALYASEQKNLFYVGTAQECFRPLAAYDYARPPHEGRLWYARFQWVPFRHPRIDFTKPKAVCAALAAFAQANGLPESARPASPAHKAGYRGNGE